LPKPGAERRLLTCSATSELEAGGIPERMPIESQALVLYAVSLALVVLMKIVCFILGYLTVRLGHQLIASGVKGEFKFSGSLGGMKADLASVSPGLLFVLLGILLIGYAVYVDKPVKLTLPPTRANQPSDTLPRPPVPNELPRPN
jgi:hypothetical protein